MNPIFISYRRDDGIDTAQLLQRDLQNMFGDDAVFLDTRTMKAGDEFPTELENAVKNAKVVIAMIGKNWKGTDPQVNRLIQETDWVRKELEMALGDNNKKILPVFVKGAKLSDSFKDLPTMLERLTKFNGIELREKEFKHDLVQIVPVIEPFVPLNDPLKDLPIDEDKYRYPPGSPFKGLDYFTEKDARLFFGRGHEIRKLYNKIRNNDLMFLFGQSGSGKSSLLFAGLKPRLEFKEWTVQYIRREAGVNLAEKLDEYLSTFASTTKLLVILDQVEEIFTNPDKTLTSDAELQQLVSGVKGVNKKYRILLSFRKEYLAEIEKWFADVEFEKTYLEPLQPKGVLDAIRGITLSVEASDNYELKFADAEVPMAIAQAVLADEESHVAPLLQVLLRKMWDEVAKSKPRIFSKELLGKVKSENLVSLLNDQIEAMKERFPEEVENGLVLDVLYFFTTPRGTSAARATEELVARYNHKEICKIVTELKNKYLLSEPKEESRNMTRLAHDALAPLILELYAQSNLNGQRASRILEIKKQDIEASSAVEFSKTDLSIIDAGKNGMRKLTDAEILVIENSRQRIQQHELQLEEKNKQLELALKEANEQTLQARAKALAATARQMMQTDPTMALRLAETACKTTPNPTKEAQSAFSDFTTPEIAFYKNIWLNSYLVRSVVFSPNGKFILAGGYGPARLWSLDGTLKQTFEGHQDCVNSVAFSPDGNFILTGSSDKTARLWSLDGTSKQIFQGHQEGINSAVFSPDGKLILTGSFDKTCCLWSLDGRLKQILHGHRDGVSSVAFSPDGKSILTGSIDHTARLWSLDGILKQTFEEHQDMVNSVSFSPDGKFIVTGSCDETFRVWSLDGTLKQTIYDQGCSFNSVVFSPNGRFILTCSNDTIARIWSLNGKLKHTFKGHRGIVSSIAFSPDGKFILTGSDDKAMRLWTLEGTPIHTFEGHQDVVSSVAFSPDGKLILTGSWDAKVLLWSLEGTSVQTFEGHQDVVSSVAFSPDGKLILTGSWDATARLWSLNGKLKQTIQGNKDKLLSITFSPDGKFILIGSEDKTAKLWSLKGELRQTFQGHQKGVSSVAFSPDGKLILTGSFDKTARLWSLDGTSKQIFQGHQKGVNSAVFSPDGKLILTGSFDKTACLWSLDGTLKQTLKYHRDCVSSVAFSPDGKFILTGSFDHTLRTWTIGGKLKQIQINNQGEVHSVAFSPNGKLILNGSFNGTARLRRPFWELINPENTYVPTPEQMKEYDIPEDMEWGKVW